MWALLLGVYGAAAAESPPKAAAERGKRQCVGNTGKAGNNSNVRAWAPLSARSGGMCGAHVPSQKKPTER